MSSTKKIQRETIPDLFLVSDSSLFYKTPATKL